MKRNKALHPLSHDHHHGLVLAQLIKKGSPEYPKLPKTAKGKLDYTFRIYDKKLIGHFDDEENILFPFVYGRNSEIDSLIEELKEEHTKIKNLIALLKENEDVKNVMDELGKLLQMHIRKEERKFFNLIEKHLTDNESVNHAVILVRQREALLPVLSGPIQIVSFVQHAGQAQMRLAGSRQWLIAREMQNTPVGLSRRIELVF